MTFNNIVASKYCPLLRSKLLCNNKPKSVIIFRLKYNPFINPCLQIDETVKNKKGNSTFKRVSTGRKQCGSWQVGTVGTVGTARILNSNYYNSLIINDSNILEEKTRGVPTVPTVPTFLCLQDVKSDMIQIYFTRN